MLRDKQLRSVELNDVVEKRRLGQALNAKKFAVLVGVSYSAAREWFRVPGFPVFRGFIFWQDFAEWRRSQTGLAARVQPDTQFVKWLMEHQKEAGVFNIVSGLVEQLTDNPAARMTAQEIAQRVQQAQQQRTASQTTVSAN